MILTGERSGEKYRIEAGHELAKGGEARIFALPDHQDLVAKLWHRPTAERIKKVRVMIEYPPVDPQHAMGHVSLTWPKELLLDAAGRAVGFVMPRVNRMHPIVQVFNPRARLRHWPLFNWRYLHRTGRNLATVMYALHTKGYVVGDLNELNILVSETALVCLVDTDSFQVRDPNTGYVFRCRVGRPEFTPPELQGIRLSEVERRPEHDLFGLGIILFQLLMEGTHPFSGSYVGKGEPPSLAERIASGFFPYADDPTCPIRPSPATPQFQWLYPPLQALFLRCFTIGHLEPERRPAADEWAQVLTVAEEQLQPCATNPQHWYSAHLDFCPWCLRAEQLGGWDSFPSVEAVRRGAHLLQDRRRRAMRLRSSAQTVYPRLDPAHATRILRTLRTPPRPRAIVPSYQSAGPRTTGSLNQSGQFGDPSGVLVTRVAKKLVYPAASAAALGLVAILLSLYGAGLLLGFVAFVCGLIGTTRADREQVDEKTRQILTASMALGWLEVMLILIRL